MLNTIACRAIMLILATGFRGTENVQTNEVNDIMKGTDFIITTYGTCVDGVPVANDRKFKLNSNDGATWYTAEWGDTYGYDFRITHFTV